MLTPNSVTSETVKLRCITPEKYKCSIALTPDVKIYSKHSMPNKFKRFMIKLFFGFTYEKAED